MTRSVSRAFTEQMAIELEKLADPKTKAWWSKYLEGTAGFRGVKMADTRRVVKALVPEHGLEDATAERYLSVAYACIDQSNAEAKIAGVLLLVEHGLGDDRWRRRTCDAVSEWLDRRLERLRLVLRESPGTVRCRRRGH